MAAGKLDLVIEKGAKFEKNLTYLDNTKTPIPMAGFTAKMQVRTNTQATSAILELTTENGGITLNDTTGEIDLFVSGTDTAAITKLGNAVYDLELIDTSNEPIKLVRGTVSFIEEVTR